MAEEELRKEFRELVKKVVERFGAKTVARLFDVSRPTVRRWMDGVNYPHRLMIPMAIRELKAKLEE